MLTDCLAALVEERMEASQKVSQLVCALISQAHSREW